jgi:Tfp pilus assembly protein PilF
MQISKNGIDEAIFYYQKALELNPNSAQAYKCLGKICSQQRQWQQAISHYQKAIELQPDNWEAIHYMGDALLNLEEWEQAANAYRSAIELNPDSVWSYDNLKIALSKLDKSALDINATKKSVPSLAVPREIPVDIEDCVDLTISTTRRQLMDSAIVNQFETLLNQILIKMNNGVKDLDLDALVHSLAEIKTDIYYLKTKLSHPSPETVDPQAKKTIDPHQLLDTPKPIPIKCDLRNRIVGKGWHDPEPNGRWTGASTVSSVVLPHPCTGKYKFEMLVKAEVVPNLIDTLQIRVNDELLELSITKAKNSDANFLAIVQAEIMIVNQLNYDFLAIDLIIEKTISPESLGLNDSRFIGLFVEQINLIYR